MMDIVGYALIDRDATTGVGQHLDTFKNQPCRVMEFAADGGVLVLNPQATALAMFDEKDAKHRFKCFDKNGVLVPPDITNCLEQLAYIHKAKNRKGGYGPIVRKLVIAASLHRGEFCDSLLWEKQ